MGKRQGRIRVEYQIPERHDAGVFLQKCAKVLDMPESSLCKAVAMAIFGECFKETDDATDDAKVRQAGLSIILQSRQSGMSIASPSPLQEGDGSEEELEKIRKAFLLDDGEEEN